MAGNWIQARTGLHTRGARIAAGPSGSPTAHRRAITSHRGPAITNGALSLSLSLPRQATYYILLLLLLFPPVFNPPPSRFPPPHPPYQHIRPLSTYFPGVRYSSRNSFELHISLAHREITPRDRCKLAM